MNLREAKRYDEAVFAFEALRKHETDAAIDLEFRAFAGFQLEWRLVRSDGVAFLATFYPPPMPPPGGIPQRALHIAPRAEIEVATLYSGISGFFDEARGHQSFAPLPAGRYEVVIGRIDLGTG